VIFPWRALVIQIGALTRWMYEIRVRRWPVRRLHGARQPRSGAVGLMFKRNLLRSILPFVTLPTWDGLSALKHK
jgi:hypothetical protein